MKKFTDLRESNKGSVSVNTKHFDWGKMMTVHHGSSVSYPLHPEHQEAISKLKPGEKTHFKDETGNQVHAHRVDNEVHLHRPNHSNTPTKVPFRHFDKGVKEEADQIDELSKSTLDSYMNKAKTRLVKHMSSTSPSNPSDAKKSVKLASNMLKAKNKGGNYTEEVDQIDELKKSTLGSYVKKATNSATMSAYGAGGESQRHAGEPVSKRPDTYGADRKVAIKRLKGIDKATDRLTKEETEQIDELSKGTLSGFIKKSKETFKDVPDAKKGNRLRNVLIAAGKKDAKNEEASSRVYKPEVERAFPASGVKTIVPKHKYSTMPKDKEKAKGVPAGSMYKEEIQNIEEGPKDPPFEPSKSPFKKPNNPNRSFLDTVKALAQKGKKEAEKKSIKESELDEAQMSHKEIQHAVEIHKMVKNNIPGASAGRSNALKGAQSGLVRRHGSNWRRKAGIVDAGVSQASIYKEATGDTSFDSTMKSIVKGTSKQRTADRIAQKKQNQERARNAFGSMFGGGNPADKLKIKEDKVDEAKTNPSNVTQLKKVMSLAKANKNSIKVHNPTNDKVNENSLHADFLKMLNDKGIKHRVHGTPEQEKQRTAEKLASNKAKVDASPKKPAGPGTFGSTKGYGQGRYMGD
jgi:hypothetical protein